ncbi:MAG: hypothetical protein M1378_00315 [Bacteroidetes bacterium]|nr:hypothetical protein [Bacteroidota bacterium]
MPGYLRPHTQTIFPGPGDPRFKLGQNYEGSPGWYWVELTLHPHPVLFSEVDVTSLRNEFIGDSLVTLSDPLLIGESRRHIFTIQFQDSSLEFFVYCNQKGRLSHFNVHFRASNYDEAIEVARTNIQPFLSGWATRFNIPIYVFRIRVQEEATNIVRNILYHQLYTPVRISYEEINRLYWFPRDTRLLSFYHEALNSTNPKYQFLCYFKVIELVLGLRGKKAAEAKTRRERTGRRRETLPDEEWFRLHLAPDVQARLVGKKFTTIRDNVLRPIRTRIAHGLLDNDMDSEISDEEVYPYMPIAKLMAERLLSAEIAEHQLD